MPRNSERNRSKSLKRWLWATIGLLLFLFVLMYGTQRYLEGYVAKKIQEASSDIFDDRYELSLEDLQINLWAQNITTSGITLSPVSPEDDSAHIERFQINSIAINDVEILSYLWDDSIVIGSVSIKRPEVNLRGRVRNKSLGEEALFKSFSSGEIPSIYIRKAQIAAGKGQMLHPSDSTLEAAVSSFEIQFLDLTIDSSTAATAPFIRYDSIQAEAEDLYTQTPQNFYDIGLKILRISSSDSSVTLDSLSVNPRYPKHTFSEQYGYETDRVDLNIPRIEAKNLHYEKLFSDRFDAEQLLVKDAEMEIFHDKRIPFPSRSHRSLPH